MAQLCEQSTHKGVMEKVFSDRFPHLSEHIFGLLDPEDFLKCLSVCKTWKKLIEENVKVWQIIGRKVVQNYGNADRDPEQWQIFHETLQCHELGKVIEVTKILIWYRNGVRNKVIKISRPPPLTYCVMKSAEKLQYLLVLSEDENGRSSIHLYLPILMNQAARYGNLDSATAINHHMMYGPPCGYAKPLELAIEHNHLSCVGYFIGFVRDREVMSASKLAARLGRLQALEIIITNLDSRGLLNDNSLHGPLCMALEFYQLETFRFLIDRFENVFGFVKSFFSGEWYFSPNAMKALIEYAYSRTLTRPDHFL